MPTGFKESDLVQVQKHLDQNLGVEIAARQSLQSAGDTREYDAAFERMVSATLPVEQLRMTRNTLVKAIHMEEALGL